MQKSVASNGEPDFDVIENLLHHMFYDHLRISPDEHEIVACTKPGEPPKDKQSLFCLLFENFYFNGAALANSVLYSFNF